MYYIHYETWGGELVLNRNMNVIDFYAGAGGLSLGAYRAGFKVVAAVEWDKKALHTHKVNFPNSKHIQEDIAQLSTESLIEKIDIGKKDIHGIIGGPPCQGFSSMGFRDINDPRNDLFVRFFYFVQQIEPLFFVAENVPGIMSSKFNNTLRKAFALIDGYVILPPLEIRANEYGAPTTRTRIFFIGYKKGGLTNNIILNDIKQKKNNHEHQVTVKEALKGIPSDLCYSKNATGLMQIDFSYLNESLAHKEGFHFNVTSNIPDGVGNDKHISNYQQKGIVSGMLPTKHSSKVAQRYKQLGLGEQDEVSKSVKLNPDGFCPTIRAGTGPDKGSYQAVRPIHYNHARVITPREAARLQGFPDWFELPDTIWHSFRQIGNSVSPIVAEKILSAIYQKLTL